MNTQSVVTQYWYNSTNYKSGPMPNEMAALPNTGGTLCSTPQFGYAVTLPRRKTR